MHQCINQIEENRETIMKNLNNYNKSEVFQKNFTHALRILIKDNNIIPLKEQLNILYNKIHKSRNKDFKKIYKKYNNDIISKINAIIAALHNRNELMGLQIIINEIDEVDEFYDFTK